MRFDAIKGQDQPIRILSILIRKRLFPHALLFTGIDGIGKRSIGLAFARALNCGAPRSESIEPCGVCNSCKKIQKLIHPDIHVIEPSGLYIRVDQIRELISALLLKPCEARTRVVVISDAHQMNPESSNALLKLLEEPPDNTVLILTAPGDADLLPTIVSRCHPIRFQPIPAPIIQQILVSDYKIEPSRAFIFSLLSDGSIGKAITMALNPFDWIQHRNRLSFFLALDTQPKTVSSILSIAENLSKQKDLVQDSLELLKNLYRDLLICKYHQANRVINQDLVQQLIAISSSIKTETLFEKFQLIQTTQTNLLANANTRLSLENLMLHLM